MKKSKKIILLSVSLIGLFVFLQRSEIAKATAYNLGSTASTAFRTGFTLKQPIVITSTPTTPDPFGLPVIATALNTVAFVGPAATSVPDIVLYSGYKIQGSPGVLLSASLNTGKTYGGYSMSDKNGNSQIMYDIGKSYSQLIIFNETGNGNCHAFGVDGVNSLPITLMTSSKTCVATSLPSTSAAVNKGEAYVYVRFQLRPSQTTLVGDLTLTANLYITYS